MQMETLKDERQPKVAEHCISEQLQDQAETMPVDQASEDASVSTTTQPMATQPPPLPNHSSSSHFETSAADRIHKRLMSDCSEIEEEVISGPYAAPLDMGSELVMDSLGDHTRHPRRVSWAEYKQRRKSATERRDSGGYEPQHQGFGETTTRQKTGLKLGAPLESPEKAQHVERPAAGAVAPSASTVTSDSTHVMVTTDSQSPLTASKESSGKEEVKGEMAASTTAEALSLGSQKLSPVIPRMVVKHSPDNKRQISQDVAEKVAQSPEKLKLVQAAPTGGSVSTTKGSIGDPKTISSLSVLPTAPSALASTKEKEKVPNPVVQKTVVSEKEAAAGTTKGGASTKDVIGRVPSSQPSVSPVQRFSIPVHQGGAQPIAPHTHEPIAPPHTRDPIVPPHQHEPLVPQHQHEPSPHFLLPPPHAHPPPHAPPGPHGSWFQPSAWTRNVLGPHIAPPAQPWGPYGGYFHPHQHSGYPPYGPFPPGISPDDMPPPPPDELTSRSPSPSSSSHSSRSRSLSRSESPTGEDSPEVVDDADREFELIPGTSDASTQATCRTSSQLIQVGSGFKFRSMSTQTVRRPITKTLAIQVNMDPKMYSKRVQTNPPHIVSSFTQTVCKTRSRGVQTVQEPEPPKPLHAGLEALKLLVENVEFSDGEEIVRKLRDYLATMIGLGSGSSSDYDLTDMSCDEENEDDVFEGDDQSQLSTQPGIPSPVISGASNISEGDLSDLLSEGSPSGKASVTSEPNTPLNPIDPGENDSHSVQHCTVSDSKAAAPTETEKKDRNVGTETPHHTQLEADAKADCSTPPPLPPPPLPSSVPPLPPFPAPSLPPPPPPSVPSHFPTPPESQPTGLPCPPEQQQTLEDPISKNITLSIQDNTSVKQLQMVTPLPPIQEEPSTSFETREVQVHALETTCPLDCHNEEFDDSPSVCYVRCMSLPPFKLSGANSSGRTSSSSTRSTPTPSPGTELPVTTDSARVVADYNSEDTAQVGSTQRACSSSPPTARRFRKRPTLTKEELLAKVRARKSHGGTGLEAGVEDQQKREVILEARREEEIKLELEGTGKKSTIDMHQLMVNFHNHMAEVASRKVQDASWIRYRSPYSAQYPTIPYHWLPVRPGFELGCQQVVPWDVEASSGSEFQMPAPTQDIRTASESEPQPPIPSTEDSLESHSSGPTSKPGKPEPQMSGHSPPPVAEDSGTKPSPSPPEISGEGGIQKDTLAEPTKEPQESSTNLRTATAGGHEQSDVLDTSEIHADKQVPVSDSILESERHTLDHPTPDTKSVNLSPSSIAETPNTTYYSVPATPETASPTPTEWFTPSMQFGLPMGARRGRRSMLGLSAVESPNVLPGERTIVEEDETMDTTSESLVCWKEQRKSEDVSRSDESNNQPRLESRQPESRQEQGESVPSGSQVIPIEGKHSPDQSQRFHEVAFPGVTERPAHLTAGEVPPQADCGQDTDQQMLAEEEGDDGEGTGSGGCGETKESCGRMDFDASPEILRGGDKEDFSYSKVESPKILSLQSLYTDSSQLNVPPPDNAMEYTDEVLHREVGNQYVPSLQSTDMPNVFSLEVESVDPFCDVSAAQDDCEPTTDRPSLAEHSAPSQLAQLLQSSKSCIKESDRSLPLETSPPFSSGAAVETVETTNVDCTCNEGEVCGGDTCPQKVDQHQHVAETIPQRALVVSIPRAGCVAAQPERNFSHNHFPSPDTLKSSDPQDYCFHVKEGISSPSPACDENSASHSETPQPEVHNAEDADCSAENLDSFFFEVATPELHTPNVKDPSSSSQSATTPPTHSFQMSSFRPSSPTNHECSHTPLTPTQPPTSSELRLKSPEKRDIDQGDEHPVGVSTRQPSSETVLAVMMTTQTVCRSPQHETPPSPAQQQVEKLHHTPTKEFQVCESVPSRAFDLTIKKKPFQAEDSVISESAQDKTSSESNSTGAKLVKSKGIEEDQVDLDVDLDHLKPVGVVFPAGQELVDRSETGGEGDSEKLNSPSQSQLLGSCKNQEHTEASQESTEETLAGSDDLSVPEQPNTSDTDKHVSSGGDLKPTGLQEGGVKPKVKAAESDEELEEGEIVDMSDNEPPSSSSSSRDADCEVIDSTYSPAAEKTSVVHLTEDILSKSLGDSGVFESEAPTIEMAVCDNPAQPPLPQSPPPTHEIGPPPLPTTPPPFEAAPNKEETPTSDGGVTDLSSVGLGKSSPKSPTQNKPVSRACQPPQLLSPKSPPQPFGPNVQPFGPNPAPQPRPLFASHTNIETAPLSPKPLFPVKPPQTLMSSASSSNQNPGINTMPLQPPNSEGSTPCHPKPQPLMTLPTSLMPPSTALMQEWHLDGGHQPPCSTSASPPHIPQQSGSSLLSRTNSTTCSSKSAVKPSPSSQRSCSESQASSSSSSLRKPPSKETRAVSPRRLSSPGPSLHHHSSGSENLPSQSGLRDPTITSQTQRPTTDSQASSSSSILRKPPSQAPPRRLSSPSPSLHRSYHPSLDDSFHMIPPREAELDLVRLHSPYAPPPPPFYRYHRPLPPPLPPAPQWHNAPPVRHRREFPYDLDSPPFDDPQFGHPEGGFYTYRYF